MRCISEISIQDPSSERAYDRINVPCGRCYACLNNKRSDWSFRLRKELKTSITAYFVTLTYGLADMPLAKNDKHSLYKKDLQDFIKRLREENREYVPKNVSVRYYAVGEYGTKTVRPHYHAILFNVMPIVINDLYEIWGKGMIHVGDVNDATIHYTTKYMVQNLNIVPDVYPPFSIMSRKPPIGVSYLENNKEMHNKAKMFYVTHDGHRQRLPRYYRDKMFTAEEKQEYGKIMEQKFDKEDIESQDKLISQGLNPWKYSNDVNEDQKRKLNKTLKKDKL